MNSHVQSTKVSASNPWKIAPDWPAIDPEARVVSERLVTHLRKSIEAAGGAIPFSDYMEHALYAPGLGYYSAGARKFGEAGDFVTAPEVSPLFSRCLARACQPVLKQLKKVVVIEFGAGTGVMAADVLAEFERLDCLPKAYWIIERSADLRLRQQETLRQRIPHLMTHIEWLEVLPDQTIDGVILANELLDALPVERFSYHKGNIQQYAVGWQDDVFTWQLQPATGELAAAVLNLMQGVDADEGYSSEINLQIRPWLKTAADILNQGAMILIDYGYPRHEFYHPQRASGTLMCHYRHRAHADPLILPGLQDITAHVDFTAVAEASDAAGLSVAGFTTQAHFLLENGLEEMMSETDVNERVDYLTRAQQVKTLVMPGEMGERFKCIALTKNVAQTPIGFRQQDLRSRL